MRREIIGPHRQAKRDVCGARMCLGDQRGAMRVQTARDGSSCKARSLDTGFFRQGDQLHRLGGKPHGIGKLETLARFHLRAIV